MCLHITCNLRVIRLALHLVTSNIVPALKGTLKIGGRALHIVSRLPASISGWRESGRNTFYLVLAKLTIVQLFRLQMIACRDLLAMDRNGSRVPRSYHYYCVTDSFFLSTRFRPSCSNVSQTLPTSAAFNFPIYISLADKFGEVELVVWDKDMLISQVELMCTDYCDGGPTKN
jgi:phosphatidylserine decarboxylase